MPNTGSESTTHDEAATDESKERRVCPECESEDLVEDPDTG